MLRTILFSFVIVLATTLNSFSAPKDVDVYVIRGLFGFLFQNFGGVYRIKDELAEKGYTVHFTCWQTPCQNAIIENIKNNPGRKFALIGHSMGGNAVTEIGQELKKLGISIPYAAVIDAPMPSKLEDNFKIVDNFYQFNDWRNPVLVAKGKSTKLKQFDFRRKYNHFSVADAPETTNQIYKQLDKLAKKL